MPTIESDWDKKIAEVSRDPEVLDLARKINQLAESLDVNVPFLLDCLKELAGQAEEDNL